jgi:signal transduction histidine kinase
MLAAPDGLLLYHTDPTRIGGWLPDAPHTRAALRGESGADTHTDLQGRELVTAFAPVSRTGWSVLQEERWTEMVSPLMRYSEAAPLVLIPGLAITALAVWFAIHSIVRPLQRLESRAADLAAGDFASIEAPVGGIEEIRRLQASLSAMADQLEKAQDAMRTYIGAITRAQEEERLRLARELHDHTIQALIALDQRQQMLKRHLVEDPAAADRLAELRRMTADAIDELRRLIRAMRPIYLEELGLLPALEMLARDLDASWIAVRFERHGQPAASHPTRR